MASGANVRYNVEDYAGKPGSTSTGRRGQGFPWARTRITGPGRLFPFLPAAQQMGSSSPFPKVRYPSNLPQDEAQPPQQGGLGLCYFDGDSAWCPACDTKCQTKTSVMLCGEESSLNGQNIQEGRRLKSGLSSRVKRLQGS